MDTVQQTKMTGRRISPGGLITLPFVARLVLEFEKGKPKKLAIRISDDGVLIYPSQGTDKDIAKASPRGLLQLSSAAHSNLTEGKNCRYNLEIRKDQSAVLLRPD